ncbi:Phosphopantetheine attachment site [Mycolicibacterium phlei]|nr:acyl carrier protein [Mycobacteroides chelonae]SKO65768.1 Phosphopantetheine attachment site [Mycobacteroides abscessus subsp. bolletii]VEG14771.1 Phosphopantetheine attachment site [Mycolicibacterium phlei]MBF9352742.1 acyl carrier protein [Mycobacteroides chelonae]MBF9519960.1 acyl carrier protein [Mycobacteroides chelonae]
MPDNVRNRIVAAVCDVLYISESELFDGDATDLRELGLDSVRFVLLMKQLGVARGSDLQKRLVSDLSVAGWAQVLEQAQPEGVT